ALVDSSGRCVMRERRHFQEAHARGAQSVDGVADEGSANPAALPVWVHRIVAHNADFAVHLKAECGVADDATVDLRHETLIGESFTFGDDSCRLVIVPRASAHHAKSALTQLSHRDTTPRAGGDLIHRVTILWSVRPDGEGNHADRPPIK